MAIGIPVPQSGTVLQWLKPAGAWAAPGEAVAAVAAGGTVQVVPAPAGGLITAILSPPGRQVAAGEHLGLMEAALPGPRGEKLVPWNPLRRQIAAHMQYSSSTAAHITTGVEVDLSRLEALRESLRRQGLSLHLTPFFIRAAAEALVEWPCVNGQVTPDGLWIPDRVDITVPVALHGDVYPVVLREAPSKPVSWLAAELQELTNLARAGQRGPALSDGGTFAVTNPGSLGSVWGSAIINQPNCAILICHAVVRRPVATADDRVEIRPIMNLGLSFDHRVLDGVVSLGYLKRVKELLEAAAFPL